MSKQGILSIKRQSAAIPHFDIQHSLIDILRFNLADRLPAQGRVVIKAQSRLNRSAKRLDKWPHQTV